MNENVSVSAPKAIATIALAFGLILLALGCGTMLQEYLSGQLSALRIALPLATLVLGFTLLAMRLWYSRA